MALAFASLAETRLPPGPPRMRTDTLSDLPANGEDGVQRR